MEFLFEYLAFLAKTATVVIAALVVISALAAASAHRALRTPPVGHIESKMKKKPEGGQGLGTRHIDLYGCL